MKKLYIDYDKCLACEGSCDVACSYAMHPDNEGITSLREAVAFMFVCRKCEDYPCVNSCPNDALSRESGVISRATFKCTSCKTCSIACPFGTILPELLPYVTSRCDACLGRLGEGENPLCVDDCREGALKYIEESEVKGQENTFAFGENIIVKAVNWLHLYGIKK